MGCRLLTIHTIDKNIKIHTGSLGFSHSLCWCRTISTYKNEINISDLSNWMFILWWTLKHFWTLQCYKFYKKDWPFVLAAALALATADAEPPPPPPIKKQQLRYIFSRKIRTFLKSYRVCHSSFCHLSSYCLSSYHLFSFLFCNHDRDHH